VALLRSSARCATRARPSYRRGATHGTYSVDGGEPQVVKVSRDDIRRQIPLEGTGGQYQFMMEFIYSAITVPDFVTIRVSGIPAKLAERRTSETSRP
jgi:hypothetical protein